MPDEIDRDPQDSEPDPDLAGTAPPASRPSDPETISMGPAMEAGEVARLEAAVQAFTEWGGESSGESRMEFLERHADLRDLLEPMLRAVGENDEAEVAEPVEVDDFRIEREVGRGGMGVVYEARQVSLGRRVAFKVLPPQFIQSPEAIARFKREATTAARLNHHNVVKVFAVGESDLGHYIAMEFVEGTPLEDILNALCDREISTVHGRDLLQVISPKSDSVEVPPFWDRGYVPTVLDLVAQVADALEHAREYEVIHRDVKPGNILIREDGRAMLADFGLAKQEALPSVTVSGALAGTPRYLSPEQATGRTIDHRTDVYSLGVTLYEILTQQLPFDAETTHDLLAQIIHKEPRDPRRLNPHIARDLASIVHKALEKDLERRYQTAGEFAADLRAFLDHRPVQARRASTALRVRRWMRREPLKASMLGLLIASVLIVSGLGGYIYFDREWRTDSAGREAAAALADARLAMQQGKWGEARASAQAARDIVRTAGVSLPDVLEGAAELEREAELEERNLTLLRQLEDVRQPEGGDYYPVAWLDVANQYRRLFAADGLDLLAGTEEDVIGTLRGRRLPEAVLGMIDTWTRACVQAIQKDHAARLGRLADAIDKDEVRRSLRAAMRSGDREALIAAGQRSDLRHQSPATLELLGGALLRSRQRKLALEIYRKAHSWYPRDFVLATGLARALLEQRPPLYSESSDYFTAALTMNPDSVEVRHELGRVLYQSLEQHARAARLFRESVERRPDDPHLLWHLGHALLATGDYQGARVAYQKVVDMKPEFAPAHQGLGDALSRLRQFEPALKSVERALRLDGKLALSHLTRGQVLTDLSRFEDAIRSFQNALKHPGLSKHQQAQCHSNLGVAQASLGRFVDAAGSYRAALKIEPTLRQARHNLAQACLDRGLELERLRNFEGAIEQFRRGLGHGRDAVLLYSCGNTLLTMGRNREAIGYFEDAIADDAQFAEAWCNLSVPLTEIGDYDRAERAIARGHALGSKRSNWSNPSAEMLADVRRAQRLDRILRARVEPANPQEIVAAARLAARDGRTSLAVMWFERAFATVKTLRSGRTAVAAARAALRTACGDDRQPPRQYRPSGADLRRRALDWLRGEFKRLEQGAPDPRRAAANRWLGDAVFVQARKDVAHWPATESKAWSAFWVEVEAAAR